MALSFLDREQARHVAQQIKEAYNAKGMDLEIRITPIIEGKIPKFKVWSPEVKM